MDMEIRIGSDRYFVERNIEWQDFVLLSHIPLKDEDDILFGRTMEMVKKKIPFRPLTDQEDLDRIITEVIGCTEQWLEVDSSENQFTESE